VHFLTSCQSLNPALLDDCSCFCYSVQVPEAAPQAAAGQRSPPAHRSGDCSRNAQNLLNLSQMEVPVAEK